MHSMLKSDKKTKMILYEPRSTAWELAPFGALSRKRLDLNPTLSKYITQIGRVAGSLVAGGRHATISRGGTRASPSYAKTVRHTTTKFDMMGTHGE